MNSSRVAVQPIPVALMDRMPSMEIQPYGADEVSTMDFLKLDYEAAQAVVDKLDGHLFAVRSWAVTTTGAIAALSLSVEQPLVLLVGLMPIVLFAFLELMYKGYHDEAISKSKYVETQIQRVAVERSSLDPDYRFGIGDWIHRPRIRRMTWTFLNRREIPTFYVGLILILLLALGIYSVWIPK
jgi:hypothetical protein